MFVLAQAACVRHACLPGLLKLILCLGSKCACQIRFLYNVPGILYPGSRTFRRSGCAHFNIYHLTTALHQYYIINMGVITAN